MYILLAIVTCINGADVRTSKVELDEGTYEAMVQSQQTWGDGTQTFDTQYGKCTIKMTSVEQKKWKIIF